MDDWSIILSNRLIQLLFGGAYPGNSHPIRCPIKHHIGAKALSAISVKFQDRVLVGRVRHGPSARLALPEEKDIYSAPQQSGYIRLSSLLRPTKGDSYDISKAFEVLGNRRRDCCGSGPGPGAFPKGQ